MGIRIIIAAAVPVFLILQGCGGPTFDFVGTWKGSRPVASGYGIDPSAAQQVAETELKIKSTGEFTLEMGGMPVTGTVSFSGNSAALNPDTYMGQPLSSVSSKIRADLQGIVAKGEKDGSVHLNHDLLDPQGITLKRLVIQP